MFMHGILKKITYLMLLYKNNIFLNPISEVLFHTHKKKIFINIYKRYLYINSNFIFKTIAKIPLHYSLPIILEVL